MDRSLLGRLSLALMLGLGLSGGAALPAVAVSLEQPLEDPVIDLPPDDIVSESQEMRPADPEIDEAALQLFRQLQGLQGNGTLFGQHDAPLYGLDSTGEVWRNIPTSEAGPGLNEDRSDIKTATGSHPALVGFDVVRVVRELLLGQTKEANYLASEIRKAHARGQVVTISWHAHDPVDGALDFSGYPARVREARRVRRELLSRDPLECARLPHCRGLTDIELPEARRVARILPGGPNHADFLRTLDVLADFLGGLRDERGGWIPIIFRPWHEQNGSWFWWGGEFRTAEEYANLWRLTVDYLRKTRGLHHLLIAYSPNQSNQTRAEYFTGYPGPAYIDIFGLDAYHTLDSVEGSRRTGAELGWIVRAARARGKIAALTETGLEAFRWGPYHEPARKGEANPKWFSQNLGQALAADPDAARLAYIMVWRNASAAHHFFPGPNALETIEDFLLFRQQHRMLLLDDLIQSRGAGVEAVSSP
jgi:mannan endo-1,4-beta-mannosidase